MKEKEHSLVGDSQDPIFKKKGPKQESEESIPYFYYTLKLGEILQELLYFRMVSKFYSTDEAFGESASV